MDEFTNCITLLSTLYNRLRFASYAAVATSNWVEAHSFLVRWLHPMEVMFGAAEVRQDRECQNVLHVVVITPYAYLCISHFYQEHDTTNRENDNTLLGKSEIKTNQSGGISARIPHTTFGTLTFRCHLADKRWSQVSFLLPLRYAL